MKLVTPTAWMPMLPEETEEKEIQEIREEEKDRVRK